MFEQTCIVELFGHARIAGKVSEQTIGGQGFVRVDVPEIEGQKTFTKFYGPNAIYAITPVDETTMLLAVKGLRIEPIHRWELNIPELAERVGEITHDPDEYDEDGKDGF